jgi:hypothetical protein
LSSSEESHTQHWVREKEKGDAQQKRLFVSRAERKQAPIL